MKKGRQSEKQDWKKIKCTEAEEGRPNQHLLSTNEKGKQPSALQVKGISSLIFAILLRKVQIL